MAEQRRQVGGRIAALRSAPAAPAAGHPFHSEGPAPGPKRGRHVRSLLPRGTLLVSAVLLGTVLFAGTAEARRPVVAPGQQSPPKPPPPPPPAPAAAPAPPAAENAPAPGPRAPVGTPSTPEAPKEPPKPVDFVDAAAVSAPAERAAAPAEVGPYKELRHTRVAGDMLYVLAVRPGEPKAGEPVELFFKISEILPIPDPAYGDRKPLENGKLRVRVSGGGLDRTFEVHELADAGTYGAHFTAAGTGVYRLGVERVDGRRTQQVEFQLGVGVATPGVQKNADATPRRSRNGIVEGVQLVGVRGPDDASIAGVMDELGRRWMELERHAGTPAAAAAAAEVRQQAALLAGKMPQVQNADATEWEQLTAALVGRAESLGSGDRAAVLSSMQKTSDEVCMRCHAKYRFQFADSVAAWPNFSVNPNLQQPPAAAPRSTGRARLPFRAK